MTGTELAGAFPDIAARLVLNPDADTVNAWEVLVSAHGTTGATALVREHAESREAADELAHRYALAGWADDEYREWTTPVTFYIRPGVGDALRAKARECDDENLGEHPVRYTMEQALAVVWHSDPTWLHDNVLGGWCVAESGVWTEDRVEWVAADDDATGGES